MITSFDDGLAMLDSSIYTHLVWKKVYLPKDGFYWSIFDSPLFLYIHKRSYVAAYTTLETTVAA